MNRWVLVLATVHSVGSGEWFAFSKGGRGLSLEILWVA